MNAYNYLYQYLHQRYSVQQRLLGEGAAAPIALDAAAPAVATIDSDGSSMFDAV